MDWELPELLRCCRAGRVFLSLRAGMWTGQAANSSPWSTRLWLLVCQPFPLGIPKARAPAAECPQGFPCPEQHLGPSAHRESRCAHLAGREGMKIPGIWEGSVGSQVLESLPCLAFPHEICCIFVFLKLFKALARLEFVLSV